MRILVTNDDGIDAIGLHVLARAMQTIGKVTVIAPDQEYSGCGAALWPMNGVRPEAYRASIDGIDEEEVWALKGPPGLCVTLACLGAFNDSFDLVVAGINPGTNLGRSINHSGTLGACITARSYGISGIAISQMVDTMVPTVQTQPADNAKEATGSQTPQHQNKQHSHSRETKQNDNSWDDDNLQQIADLVTQEWHTAAEIAVSAVKGLVSLTPDDPVVMNINAPNRKLSEIKGWKRTEIGVDPLRVMQKAALELRSGHINTYDVKLRKGKKVEQPIHTDGGAVLSGWVSVSWLCRLEQEASVQQAGQLSAESRLDELFANDTTANTR